MDDDRLWHRALVKLRLRRPAADISRQTALEARPVRNPKLNWRLNDQGEAVITLPRREGRLWGLVSWVFAVPESRDVSLDEIGTHVWCGCDGERSVEDLIHKLMADHRLSRREVEVSLTTYLRNLGKRGMIGFLVEQREDTASNRSAKPDPAPPAPPSPPAEKGRSRRDGASGRGGSSDAPRRRSGEAPRRRGRRK